MNITPQNNCGPLNIDLPPPPDPPPLLFNNSYQQYNNSVENSEFNGIRWRGLNSINFPLYHNINTNNNVKKNFTYLSSSFLENGLLCVNLCEEQEQNNNNIQNNQNNKFSITIMNEEQQCEWRKRLEDSWPGKELSYDQIKAKRAKNKGENQREYKQRIEDEEKHNRLLTHLTEYCFLSYSFPISSLYFSSFSSLSSVSFQSKYDFYSFLSELTDKQLFEFALEVKFPLWYESKSKEQNKNEKKRKKNEEEEENKENEEKERIKWKYTMRGIDENRELYHLVSSFHKLLRETKLSSSSIPSSSFSCFLSSLLPPGEEWRIMRKLDTVPSMATLLTMLGVQHTQFFKGTDEHGNRRKRTKMMNEYTQMAHNTREYSEQEKQQEKEKENEEKEEKKEREIKNEFEEEREEYSQVDNSVKRAKLSNLNDKEEVERIQSFRAPCFNLLRVQTQFSSPPSSFYSSSPFQSSALFSSSPLITFSPIIAFSFEKENEKEIENNDNNNNANNSIACLSSPILFSTSSPLYATTHSPLPLFPVSSFSSSSSDSLCSISLSVYPLQKELIISCESESEDISIYSSPFPLYSFLLHICSCSTDPSFSSSFSPIPICSSTVKYSSNKQLTMRCFIPPSLCLSSSYTFQLQIIDKSSSLSLLSNVSASTPLTDSFDPSSLRLPKSFSVSSFSSSFSLSTEISEGTDILEFDEEDCDSHYSPSSSLSRSSSSSFSSSSSSPLSFNLS